MTPFLNIVEYESDAHYDLSIAEYKVNVQAFYAAGKIRTCSLKILRGMEKLFIVIRYVFTC